MEYRMKFSCVGYTSEWSTWAPLEDMTVMAQRGAIDPVWRFEFREAR